MRIGQPSESSELFLELCNSNDPTLIGLAQAVDGNNIGLSRRIGLPSESSETSNSLLKAALLCSNGLSVMFSAS